MTSRWASETDIGFEVLEKVQDSLPVGMIMTLRSNLMTCTRDETAFQVKEKNTSEFSFLPVIDEKGQYLGLYNAERWFQCTAPDKPIGNDFESFSEDLIIGADASIIEFVQRADDRPTRLVVSGHHVAGLVSLSDLQALPVRASLFTLITSLEIAMAKRIEAEWPNTPDAWLQMLSVGRRDQVREMVNRAKADDNFVSAIAFTQLSDKTTVIRKARMVGGSINSLKNDFNAIRDLRDRIAHSNSYAETSASARFVCVMVRRIIEIKTELLAGIVESHSGVERKSD